MEDKRTKELSRKLLRVVDELMKKHAMVTSAEDVGGRETKMLLLFKGDTRAFLQMNGYYVSIEVKDGRTLPRNATVLKRSTLDLGRFTEKQLDTLLDLLPKYKPTEGLNIPYGYVRSGVIAVIFARTSTGGNPNEIERYLLEGIELPSDALFGDKLSTEEWYARFWNLLGSGKIVPMRKGREASGWVPPTFGRERMLKRVDLTSNKNLLGAGKYLHMT